MRIGWKRSSCDRYGSAYKLIRSIPNSALYFHRDRPLVAVTSPLAAPKEILIIEDDEATREMLATALKMQGYRVRSAPDGLAGLRLLEAYEPDVVVLDLNLPIASGFDVLTELRAVTKTRLTPVIAISGMDEYLKAARANRDFVATIPKPFEPEVIVRAVERAVRQYPV